MARSNVGEDAILSYLQAMQNEDTAPLKMRIVQLEGERNTEIARLKGELNTEIERGAKEVYAREAEIVRLKGELQLITAQYLNALGLLSMRGLMETIQDTMSVRVGVVWDKSDPQSSWRAYLAKRPSLQACLKGSNVSVGDAPKALSDMYATLSIHDSRSPENYQGTDTKLYIGPALKDQQQRALMACLCEDINLGYEFRD